MYNINQRTDNKKGNKKGKKKPPKKTKKSKKKSKKEKENKSKKGTSEEQDRQHESTSSGEEDEEEGDNNSSRSSDGTTESQAKMFEYGPLKHAGKLIITIDLKAARDVVHKKGARSSKNKSIIPEVAKPVDPEMITDQCSFANDDMTKDLSNLLDQLLNLFGPCVQDLQEFHEKFILLKCFLEVFVPNESGFRIFNFQKFDLVTFKAVFIQKLLHKTHTLFIYSLRKAKAIYPASSIHAERSDSPFFEHKTLLKEITPIYSNDKWRTLYKLQFMVNKSRYVKLPYIAQSITELNKHNPYNLTNEEIQSEIIECVACEDLELTVVPDMLTDFVYSRMYCILTKLRMSHTVKPGAVPMPGKVNDRDYYKRRDLVKLYTKVQWRNRARDIPKGEVPMKVFEFNEGQQRIEYYDVSQTVPLRIGLDADGKIPQNDYGNIEIMNGLPPGTRHIGFKGIKFVMRKMDINWVPAVTEFELRNGRFYPILNGVVVHDKDYDMVLKEYAKRKEELEKKEEVKEFKFMDKLWKDIFKSLYTKKYFKDKQT